MELLPQTENIFLVYKEGWHNPESSPQNPSLERTWTKKDALVSFKNPKKDVLVYLEADTNAKAFDQPPVLTVAVGGKTGLVVPIEDSEVFLKKIRVKAADLGDRGVGGPAPLDEPVLRAQGSRASTHTDDRELGLLDVPPYVGEADKLGRARRAKIVDAHRRCLREAARRSRRSGTRPAKTRPRPRRPSQASGQEAQPAPTKRP